MKYADDGFLKGFKSSSKRTKFIIIWVFTILIMNSLNTIAFNVV